MHESHPAPLDQPKQLLRSERRKAALFQAGGNGNLFSRNWRWYLAVIVFFGFGLGVGFLAWGSGSSGLADLALSASDLPTATTDPNTPRQVSRYDVSTDDDPAFGSPDAAVTIIEFSDYQCPYCQKWHNEVWPQLKEAYADKIRFVYRDFPLYSIHPEAGPAAEAADCANDQNKYWEFHDLLFSGQSELGLATYQAYAQNLGLDLNLFNDCIESKKYESEVKADFEYASQLGIQSTPTFFINGVALIGAQPFDVFKEIIDLELAGLLSK